MDLKQLPEDRKFQLANLIGQMGKAMQTFFFGLIVLVAIWTISKNVPKPTNYPAMAEVVPNVPWDYKAFENVDFLNPATNEQVAWGRELITETADYVGPNSETPFAGNNQIGRAHV